MPPKKLFEFDTDVESIAVNRWPMATRTRAQHLTEPDIYEMAVIGRQPLGRITIANCDTSVDAYAHGAIEETWRAVEELG